MNRSIGLFILLCCLVVARPASADNSARPTALNNTSFSMMGQLGLNTIPTARMMPTGTIHATLSRMADYTHAVMGIQVTDHLYVGVRQTGESDSLSTHADALYPGLDVKYTLFDERRFRPAIAVGLQSAIGHKRMAAEYLALSKRYHDVDFTLGFGWGRMATRDTFPNLLLVDKIKGHKDRAIDGNTANAPRDWFTGDMALFGGIDYTTPINGLSLKADWNSDAWQAEKTADPAFQKPSPWSVGLSYRPVPWIDAGVAYEGNQSVMARISLLGNIGSWPFTDSVTPTAIRLLPTRAHSKNRADNDEWGDEAWLGVSDIITDENSVSAHLALRDHIPTPAQIGQVARVLANKASKTAEEIMIHLSHYNLEGPTIILSRPAIENAMRDHRGSSEEIWHTTTVSPPPSPSPSFSFFGMLHPADSARKQSGFKLDIINDVSLSEQDAGVLYRSSVRLGTYRFLGKTFYTEQSLRFNLADNLSKLRTYRALSLFPVRGDVDDFAREGVTIDRVFLTGFVKAGRDVYTATSIGYLEEMYMGMMGEGLYRPFGKNWAIGAEAALAFKRDPLTNLATGINGDRVLSGFINGYYEVPETGVTVKASVGRYLAGDIGGGIDVTHRFDNGASIGAEMTATNQADIDSNGGKTNIYTSIRLSMPLGSIPFTPDGARIQVNTAPLGRDSAQRLDNPVPLYDMTEPLSYRHITDYWGEIVQ